MKKILILFCLLLFSQNLFAGEYCLSTEFCHIYNDFTSSFYLDKIELKYDSEFDNCFLLRYDNDYYVLSEESIATLRTVFEKYFEWEEIAVKNKVTITKTIPGRIKVAAVWANFLEDTCFGAGELYFRFFSQSETDHFLVISSTKIEDSLGGYSTKTLENLYFDKYQVRSFYDDISEEKIKEYLDTVKKNDEMESLFN